jgi:hypothetical protein
VHVTNLEKHEATPEQIALLHAKRADTENVFDELKNQRGFGGCCSQRAVVTERAARRVPCLPPRWWPSARSSTSSWRTGENNFQFWKNAFRSGKTSNRTRHDIRLKTGS